MDNILNKLFSILIEENGSDFHWADDSPIYIRIHGVLTKFNTPPELTDINFGDLTKTLIGDESYKSLEKSLEYDGARTIADNRRVRVNVFYKRGKLAWAIRLLPAKFFTLTQLGLPLDVCKEICELKQGLVLITGATGSGKTSTLATILNEINETRNEHIFTIEDPIEYIHNSKQCMVSQREVGIDTNSFHSALKSVLREDPDIVLLGEMRDKESMDAAITLAETGHLTFATLHTSGAVETTSRIISSFDSAVQGQIRERIADNLKFVISQQLVPWTNGEGRSLCPEIMVSTKAIKAMIRDKKERQMLSTLETSSGDGMTTMNKSLIKLVRDRKITKSEAILYSPDKDAILNLL